jgi:hypothetical protein
MTRTLLILIVFSISIFSFSAHAQTDEFNLDETYPIDPGGTINLQSNDADVQIIGSDRENVRVIVRYKLTVTGITFGESNEFEMIVNEDGGNLTIREKGIDFGPSGLIGVSSKEYTIEIEAPRDVNLDIDGDDDGYVIAGFDGFIYLDADDSDIRISDAGGSDFSVSFDDGSLDFDGGNGRLEIDADDGDIRVRNGNFSAINATPDDGDVEITTTLDDNGIYDFGLDDGDLTLNITGGGGEFDIRHDDADIEVSSQYEQIRYEENSAIFNLMGGSARVNIRLDDGDISLKVF